MMPNADGISGCFKLPGEMRSVMSVTTPVGVCFPSPFRTVRTGSRGLSSVITFIEAVYWKRGQLPLAEFPSPFQKFDTQVVGRSRVYFVRQPHVRRGLPENHFNTILNPESVPINAESLVPMWRGPCAHQHC